MATLLTIQPKAFMTSRKKVLRSSFLRKLIGNIDEFSAEERIFNSACMFTFLGILVSIGINYILELFTLAFLESFFLILLALVYYLSRFRKRYRLATIIFAVFTYVFLGISYFFDGGLLGPTLLLFIVSMQFLFYISPSKIAPLWVVLHIFFALAFSVIQYYYPQTVSYNYTSHIAPFLDIDFAYIILTILVYLIMTSTRNRFFQERNKVAAQKRLIEWKNRRLQHTDKERNRLFSIIAHDLRAPLTSINGYLELLTSNALDDSEKSEMQEHLLNLSTHTSEMLNNLLRWSKNQLEGNKISLETLNVAETLGNTIDIQKSIAANKDVMFLIDIPPVLTVYADKDHLDAVVRNLLSNAMKFTPSKGKVIIQARTEGKITILTVTDNGVGISDEQKSHIFSSEVKSLPGTQNERGIGLGLVMCKDFVEQQGGSIDFESTEGEGTTFRVYLKAIE